MRTIRERYECPLCDRIFSHKNRLYEHCTTDHPQKMRSVVQFYWPSDMDKVHSSLATDKPSVSSVQRSSPKMKNQSKTKFKKRNRRMKLSYPSSKTFSCDYCPQYLANVSSKERHERQHSGELRFSCEYCLASFLLEESCVRHKSNCSRLRSAIWCRFCNFYALDDVFVRIKWETHYRKWHGIQFTSDAEINFLNELEINETKKGVGNGVEGDGKTPTKYEAEIPPSLNLEEIFGNRTEITRSNNEMEEILRDDLGSDSNVIEDADVCRNIPIDASINNESSSHAAGVSQSDVIIEDNILKHSDDAVIQENATIETFQDGQQSSGDVEGPQMENISTSASESCSKSDSPTSQEDPKTDTANVNVQFDNSAGNSQSNDSREEIPTVSNVKQEVSSSDTNTEPILPHQDDQIIEPVDEKLVKYEEEVAQLNINLEEIFRSDNTCENSGSSACNNETGTRCRFFFDLTVNSDEESEPMTITIDDDDEC